MKKILLLILLSGLLYQSCHTDTGKTDEKVIVTSFYPIYIMTLNVTKDVEGVRVVNMAPPSAGCLHDYQLTPADLKVIESAQFICQPDNCRLQPAHYPAARYGR
jgi:zinc transport system substrate-binding protein